VSGASRHCDGDSDARQHDDRDQHRAPEGPLGQGTGGPGHWDAGSGRASGQVLQEVPQLAPGPGGQGLSGPVFELVGRQPTRLEVFT
jgi:hypothetical protein